MKLHDSLLLWLTALSLCTGHLSSLNQNSLPAEFGFDLTEKDAQQERILQQSPPEFAQAVVFPFPGVNLPAGRVLSFNSTTPQNQGWALVDFSFGDFNTTGNDDEWSNMTIPFTFRFYNVPYTAVYINNNGDLTFGQELTDFTSTGFPVDGIQIIAAFWADVDTSTVDGLGSNGYVWWKAVGNNTMVVAWDHVGYFPYHGDKRNTFQIMISDGTNPDMGINNTVCFCYGDMQWTTGEASGGVDGFGGTPATVGTNRGVNSEFFQVGLFNVSGTAYDGSYGQTDGIDYLDHKSLCFKADSSANIPPVVSGLPPNGTLALQCNETLHDLVLYFLAPEPNQTTFVTVQGIAEGINVSIVNASSAFAKINWIPPANRSAQVNLSFTATDGIDTIQARLSITRPPACGALTAPVARCRNVSVAADQTCRANVSAADINDGSYDPDGNPLTLQLMNQSSTNFSVGTTSVVLNVSDGTQQSTCTANVTVIDNRAPSALCLAEVNLTSGNTTITPALINAGSTDNCAISTTSINQTSLSCKDGMQSINVTLTVTDTSGNNASCRSVVRVPSTKGPEARAQGPYLISLRKAASTDYVFYGPVVLADGAVRISWTTNCPGVTFKDASVLEPTMTLPAGTAPGFCNVTLSASNGCSTSNSTAKVTIVKPKGEKRVVGQGFFDSPAGALTTNSTIAGRAKVKFTVHYNRSQSILPIGNTKFKFLKGGITFRSASFEWLITISSRCAKAQGVGTVIGKGRHMYKFLLTTCKATNTTITSTDPTVRIKIWKKTDNSILYDNLQGTEGDDTYGGLKFDCLPDPAAKCVQIYKP